MLFKIPSARAGDLADTLADESGHPIVQAFLELDLSDVSWSPACHALCLSLPQHSGSTLLASIASLC
jgi:hypothetical protein